jgi:hypothetical protein
MAAAFMKALLQFERNQVKALLQCGKLVICVEG